LSLLGIAAIGVALASDHASALPGNKALGGVAQETGEPVELVKSRSKRFVDPQAQEAFIQGRLMRMHIPEGIDGMISLPGIETDPFGRTIMTGPPRSFDPPHQRLGVPLGGTGGRLGVPSGGPGGRLDGGGHRLR
jgi:hypothetical protein